MNNASPNLTPVRGPDQIALSRHLTVSVFFIVTVFAGFWTVKTGNPLFMGALVILPFALSLLSRPDIVLVLAVLLDATDIVIPGLNFGSTGLIAKLLLVVIFVLGSALGRRGWNGERLPEKPVLILFMANIILLMAVRGTGIRALGSATWGGMIYIVLISGMLFFMAVNGLKITRKDIRWIIWGSLIAGALGAFFTYRGWSVEAQSGMMSELMQARKVWVESLAAGFLPLAFAIKAKKQPWISVLLIFCAFGLSGLGGFRTHSIALIMTLVAYGFFKARGQIFSYFLKLCVAVLMGWLCVVLLSPVMPEGVQRSFSFVPGVQLEHRMAQTAQGSIDWRIDIWKYCLKEVPQYLLVGRGSAFEVYETAGELGVYDISGHTPWFSFLTRSYHSGPLSLLLDYGALGFISGVWLTVLVIKRLWKLARRLAGLDTFESRYALFLCATLIWKWISYYLIFGAIPMLADMIAETAVAVVIGTSVLSFATPANVETLEVVESSETAP